MVTRGQLAGAAVQSSWWKCFSYCSVSPKVWKHSVELRTSASKPSDLRYNKRNISVSSQFNYFSVISQIGGENTILDTVSALVGKIFPLIQK